MDQLEAIKTLLELTAAQPDGRPAEALAVLVNGHPPTPPSRLGRLGGSAFALAKQIHKTGEATEWRTPLYDSKGMERLVHRMATLFADFLQVWAESHGVKVERDAPPGWEIVTRVRGLPAVDEAYQPSYCDDCGAELAPDGTCTGCGGAVSEWQSERELPF